MFDLLDYRRRVFEMYRLARAGSMDASLIFRQQRDDLFRTHPQSPLDELQKAVFMGLPYYDYDPAFRVVAGIETEVKLDVLSVDLGEDGKFQMKRIGRVHFDLPTGSGSLSLFWIMGYGGGMFLPFGDATNGMITYGGGRYLYDTIKGADLGGEAGELILDFNYAYHPSCAYNPRWVCPLTPPENQLPFPIPAGEKL
jgi:hypothetical protein